MIESTLVLQRNDHGNDPYSRICAWAEIGLSQWLASCMHGEPGRAESGPPTLDRSRLGRVLGAAPKLKITTHLRYQLFLNPGRRAPQHWDSTWALAYFLMDMGQPSSLRDGFLRYVHAAFYGGKGDSSSEFDKAMGQELSRLEKRFYVWLRKNAQ